MIWVNVSEDRKATMARFLNEPNRDIANVVKLQHYMELENMVHMATEVERQIKRRGNTSFQSNSASSSSSSSQKLNHPRLERTIIRMGKVNLNLILLMIEILNVLSV
jgi:hypothetical protein